MLILSGTFGCLIFLPHWHPLECIRLSAAASSGAGPLGRQISIPDVRFCTI